ncbi:ABC transporter permease [Egibacter rhizosphaerae]|uniref:ABC transporter permease n=2 Tax=Egibacter rhizosphaerae TaxID=1670831 RepID=A0A411YL01_9ACTN|nr:ABC transporter permease [Egibacter rhizosphaerae]
MVGELFVEHVQLTAYPVTLGLVLAFPLSLAAVRWQWLYPPLIGFAGLLFTVPSIALFVLMVGVTGLGMTTAVVPLAIYTLLVLVRNTVEGFNGIDRDVREAAEAMGYRRARQILTVELPLALPVIIAGLRITTVTTVGLATVATLVGSGGLGDLFTDAVMRRFPTPALVGLVLAVLLAVALDLALLAVQWLLTPWRRRAS